MSHEVFRQGEQSVGIAADITIIYSYCDLSAIRYVVIVSSYGYFCISMFTPLSLSLAYLHTPLTRPLFSSILYLFGN